MHHIYDVITCINPAKILFHGLFNRDIRWAAHHLGTQCYEIVLK